MERPKTIQVLLFNVGQGDHILIRLPDGSYGVIDFYYDLSYNPLAEPPGLTYLKQLHKEGQEVKLTFLHLSHFHRDHFKGLDSWLFWIKENNIPLLNLWLPGATSSKNLTDKICDILKDTKAWQLFVNQNPEMANYLEDYKHKFNKSPLATLENFRDCFPDCRINYLSDLNQLFPYSEESEIDVFCLAPSSKRAMKFNNENPVEILRLLLTPKSDSNKNSNNIDQNDISAVLLIKFGDCNLVLGGDAPSDSIEECIKNFKPSREETWKTNLKANFIKVFHHGSRKSSSMEIWEEFIKPNDNVYFGISAGIHQTYDHPHQETIDEIVEISNKKDTTYSLFSTNYAYLQESRETNCINDVDEVIHLPWCNEPKLSKKRKRKKSLLLDLVSAERDSNARAVNERLKEPKSFLGYLFEFNSDSSKADVKKMVSVSV